VIRRLFTIASVVSLLLFVATTVLWAQSRLAQGIQSIHHGGWLLEGMTGGVLFQLLIDPTDKYIRRIDYSTNKTPLGVIGQQVGDEHFFNCLGMDLFWGKSGSSLAPIRIFVLQIAYWPFLLLWAILPVWKMRLMLRPHRRRQRGLCSSCGYDLTGNMTGVCPECGTPVHRASERS